MKGQLLHKKLIKKLEKLISSNELGKDKNFNLSFLQSVISKECSKNLIKKNKRDRLISKVYKMFNSYSKYI